MTPVRPTLTAELIRHLANVGSGTRTPPLTGAQWAALRFFARANRLTRTASAFASFHGTTRGTASQTVKSLVDHGYLARRTDPGDGRRVIFELTSAGRAALARDPAAALERAIETLTAKQHSELASTIQALVSQLDSRTDAPFGYCDGCRHLDARGGEAFPYCALTGEPVTEVDRESLCCAFSPTRAGDD
jgi:DNA-binding MarR family transcriptional regulator